MPDSSHAEFLSAFSQSLDAGSFVKLTLSKGLRDNLRQAFVRRVEVRGEPHLGISFRHTDKDIAKNYPINEAATVVGALLGERFANAHLFTTEADIELRTSKRGQARVTRHVPTFTETLSTDHDRPKRYLLDPERSPYLRELGIVTAQGKIKSEMAAKYRQLQHLLKLFDGLMAKSALKAAARLRVVDIGCGKGYLTFALYDYCNHHLGIATEVRGVDRNAALMKSCAKIAETLGYATLHFDCADAATHDAGAADVVVALHACDTATDTAIYGGIERGASIIIAVPCCQKELRPQFKAPVAERPLFKHDTYKDRFTQMLTDAMRGLLMESQGYRTRISEFISDAHTHRNVMIAGVLDGPRRLDSTKYQQVLDMKAHYGIADQHLETLLLEGGQLPPVQ